MGMRAFRPVKKCPSKCKFAADYIKLDFYHAMMTRQADAKKQCLCLDTNLGL